MLTRPSFKPHLRLAVVPDEGVFVLSGAKQIVLRGRLYSLVAPQIDGKTPDQICTHLAPQASPAEIYYTLGQLEKKGFLTDAEESLAANDAAWWSMQQVDLHTAAERLSQMRVAITGLGIDAEPLIRLLSAAGVNVVAGEMDTAPKEHQIDVVVVDHYLRDELESINRRALESGQSWLLIKPLGVQFWLGPLFRPGTTGCWRCLAERLRSHRAVESYLYDRQSLAEPLYIDVPGTSAAIQVGWGLAASAVTSWVIRGELPDCEGKVRTFEQISWQSATHTLMKLPFCPACSPAARALGEQSSPEKTVAVNGASVNGTNGHPIDGGHINGNGGHVNGESRNGDRRADDKHNGETTNGTQHGGQTSPSRGHGTPLRPLVFEHRKKTFTRDGGHRVISPEATLARFGHHVSPITGAVSMLERISPAGDDTMHVYLAGHNLARQHRSLGQLRSDMRNMSAGKGTTDAQAKASGLCEGLERYSGVYRGDELRIRARMADLEGAAIDVRNCLLFSERQYRQRDQTNARHSLYNFVPLPFDPDLEIDWSPLWSLTRQEVRYLPTAFCYYNCPDPQAHRSCVACSNGCAAGNTIEEAVLQGFLELVERDSVALWWYNRVRRPSVDLDSFDEPYLGEMAVALAALGREMFVLDLTSDLGIPVFATWSRRLGPGAEQIVLGFGAHLDSRIALLRAVTEMTQMMSHLQQRPLDCAATTDVNDIETVHWLRTATAENQPYLNPDMIAAPRTAADFQTAWSDDVAEDVADCQRRVERLGLEMLVLDQTRQEIGLPVVKVVVPGLRHFWARFAPGRLYDVPVQLGWLPQPLEEEALNPIPMFL